MTGFYFIDFLKSSENQKIRTRAFVQLTSTPCRSAENQVLVVFDHFGCQVLHVDDLTTQLLGYLLCDSLTRSCRGTKYYISMLKTGGISRRWRQTTDERAVCCRRTGTGIVSCGRCRHPPFPNRQSALLLQDGETLPGCISGAQSQ